MSMSWAVSDELVTLAPGLQVRPRSAWAAGLPDPGPLPQEAAGDVRFLLVHHSASANSYGAAEVPTIIRGFHNLHTGPEKNWPDIAYNFFVDRTGGVWEGRAGSIGGPVIASATGGNQGFSQLVCLIGDFQQSAPTPEAMESATRVLAWMASRYGVDTAPGATASFVSRGSNRWPAGATVTTSTIAGHRDMSMTACPGDHVYSMVRGDLPAAVTAIVKANAVPPTSAAAPPTTTPPPPAADPVPAQEQAAAAPPTSLAGVAPETPARRSDRTKPALLAGGAVAITAAAAAGALRRRRTPEAAPSGGRPLGDEISGWRTTFRTGGSSLCSVERGSQALLVNSQGSDRALEALRAVTEEQADGGDAETVALGIQAALGEGAPPVLDVAVLTPDGGAILGNGSGWVGLLTSEGVRSAPPEAGPVQVRFGADVLAVVLLDKGATRDEMLGSLRTGRLPARNVGCALALRAPTSRFPEPPPYRRRSS
jgi:hypothetical protein